MKPLTLLLLAIVTITTSCKDLEDVNGNYDVIMVGENDYSSHDITLNIEMGEENRISGKSACNTYSGSFENPEENKVEIGPLMGTKMYCQDTNKIERDYMNHLSMVISVNTTTDGIEMLDKDDNVIITAVRSTEKKK